MTEPDTLVSTTSLKDRKQTLTEKDHYRNKICFSKAILLFFPPKAVNFLALKRLILSTTQKDKLHKKKTNSK